MEVLFSDDAEADLAEIGAYIGRDNEARALTFIHELQEQCEGLAHMAGSFPVHRLRSGIELRRKSYGNYLIFYRVMPSAVVIMRILHGARDYGRLLDDGR